MEQKLNTSLTIVVITFLIGIGMFLSDIYVPSLPAITHALQASPSLVKLSISSYLLGYAIPQLFFGPWSDQIGRKPIVLIGLTLAIIGSVICLFAQNIDTLILGRFIQGFGGAACLPIARVIIYDLFSGTTLAKIGSYMGLVFSIVPAIAPVVGGYLQSLFGWRANFLLMLILVVIATVAIALLLPETIAEKKPRSMHITTLCATYRQIISNKQFWAYTICTSVAFSIIMLYAAVGPFLLQKTLKLTPVQYGWTSLAILVGFIIGKYINTHLIKTFGIKKMVLFGILLMLLGGLSMLVCAYLQLTNLLTIVVPIIIALIGCGTITPNAMAGAFSGFKKEIGGAVSALYGFFQIAGAFIVTVSIAHIHEKTAMPLALTLTILGIIALFFFSALTRKTAAQQ